MKLTAEQLHDYRAIRITGAYAIIEVTFDGYPAIWCRTCGMVSSNPNDVEHRYCGNCHVFHDAIGTQNEPPKGKTEPLALYAWVGEDELGSGKIGLKQGIVPAVRIPLVAMDYHLDRLAKLLPQMEAQAATYGKKIRLCKFVATGEVAAETKAGV